jgi:hypothetical protein
MNIKTIGVCKIRNNMFEKYLYSIGVPISSIISGLSYENYITAT